MATRHLHLGGAASAMIACFVALIAAASTTSADTAPANLDPSCQVLYKATLVGHPSDWVSIAGGASVALGVTPDGSSVTVRGLQLQAPPLGFIIGLNGPLPVSANGLAVDALAGNGVTIPLAADSDALSFASAGLPSAASGIVDYTAVGFSCNTIRNGGGVCDGPFNLAATGQNTAGIIQNGLISTTVGATGARSFSFSYCASYPLAGTGTWGKIEVLAHLHGTFPPANASTCAPDFNGQDGLTIQDIFDFLNAWLAGDPRADFSHTDGLSVLDIFDFLNAWFVGC